MTVGPLPQALQEALGGGYVAALAEHWFDDDRGGVVGRGDGLQDVVQLPQGEPGRGLLVPAVPVGCGERSHHDAAHQGREAGAETGAGGGHGGGGHRAAVESAVADQDVGPAGGLAGEAQGRFDGLAAGVGEEQTVEAAGKHLAQLLDQPSQRWVHDGRVLAVDERAHLLLRGGDDPRMAVPGAGDADARGEVEVSPPVLAVDIGALSSDGDHRSGLTELRRQIGHVLSHTHRSAMRSDTSRVRGRTRSGQ